MTTPLSPTEVHALEQALDDEYRAWSTYDQVIADFGEVPPFVDIRDAEARHIRALLALFERYAVTVPTNPWPCNVARYASVRHACEAGVAAEVAAWLPHSSPRPGSQRSGASAAGATALRPASCALPRAC
ncbi:MAG: hypothetical protein LC136_07480 [Burkholderiales bacterium]|nr:hypothetical protein [Anaerolineae bacterium]MCZ2414079.1 hypothetical protein [Burkholderiales bacterium]